MLDRTDGVSLRSGFLRHSQLQPDSVALMIRGEARTYGDLEKKARRLAAAIWHANAGMRPERVGIFTYRSETAYTATLAALFAGATFVPLNPTFPSDKTARMMEAADLDVLIVDAACRAKLPEVWKSAGKIRVIFSDTDPIANGDSAALYRQDIEGIVPLAVLPALTPEDIAYLLFTSGSTGAPKGVPVTHGNTVHFMDVMSRRYGIQPEDRFSQTFDQTFDLSVFDLFMAWSNGARVCAMSPVDLLAPTRFINENAVTVWFSVPSVPVLMGRRKTLLPGTMPTLRWSLFCGEPLLATSAEMWQQAAPNSIVENLYGPTELTIACLAHRWDSSSSPALCRNGVVPIGRPYAGLACVAVDDGLKPVDEGATGELCVSGPQTTPGYWRAPEITALRYVEIPVGRHESRRFYRTGDLVARLRTGDYVFLGRVDQQIKVLGHRVELGEIESVLRSFPGVADAVAFGSPPGSSSADAVVAFVLGDFGDEKSLIAHCRAALPPYVVPHRIFRVTEFVLNANGKVDRRILQTRLADLLSPAGSR